jgi:hypothetical protein
MLCYDILALLDGDSDGFERLRDMGLVPLNRVDLEPFVRGGWEREP